MEDTSTIGSLEIDDTGAATLTAHSSTAKVLTTNNLTINDSGKLDLTNNAMVIDYDSTSPIDTVWSLLAEGYNSGSWTGDGITSSKAAAHASDTYKTAIGYADTADVEMSSFAGRSVDDTSVVIRYTWYGDGNLDGSVDTVDFYVFIAYFSQSGTHWTEGDFNYDGQTDTIDYNYFIGDFSQEGFPV
jgi:hypothetical protein